MLTVRTLTKIVLTVRVLTFRVKAQFPLQYIYIPGVATCQENLAGKASKASLPSWQVWQVFGKASKFFFDRFFSVEDFFKLIFDINFALI